MERMEEEVIDLKDLFGYLLSKILVVIIVTGICGIVTFLYSSLFIEPVYESSATLLLTNNSSSTATVSAFMLDCIEVAESSSVASAVVDQTGVSNSYEEVMRMLSVNNPSSTKTLQIKISANDPELAQQIANAYAEVIQKSISEKLKVSEPQIIDAATINLNAISPNKTKNAIIGLLVGFVASCGFYIVIYIMDDSLRKADDIERLFGIRALAVVPFENTEVWVQKAPVNTTAKKNSVNAKAKKTGENAIAKKAGENTVKRKTRENIVTKQSEKGGRML